MFQQFLDDQRGQDLVEYSLLLAFVCLAGAATFIAMGTTISSIWGIANNRLAAANCSSTASLPSSIDYRSIILKILAVALLE